MNEIKPAAGFTVGDKHFDTMDEAQQYVALLYRRRMVGAYLGELPEGATRGDKSKRSRLRAKLLDYHEWLDGVEAEEKRAPWPTNADADGA